jgi:hypothetical protein
MRERGPVAVGALVLFLLIFPLGYFVHVSPRFPGSLVGSMIGIAAATLMLVPLAYVLVKRIPSLRARVTRRVKMSTLLALHVYAGVLGPVLAVIHSAHKFQSPIGLALVAVTIIVVITGYIGRYLLRRIAVAMRARKAELAEFQSAMTSDSAIHLGQAPSEEFGLLRILFVSEDDEGTTLGRTDAALALADAEQAVRTEEVAERLLRQWLAIHIILSAILYALLALHIWAGLFYGLRWL